MKIFFHWPFKISRSHSFLFTFSRPHCLTTVFPSIFWCSFLILKLSTSFLSSSSLGLSSSSFCLLIWRYFIFLSRLPVFPFVCYFSFPLSLIVPISSFDLWVLPFRLSVSMFRVFIFLLVLLFSGLFFLVPKFFLSLSHSSAFPLSFSFAFPFLLYLLLPPSYASYNSARLNIIFLFILHSRNYPHKKPKPPFSCKSRLTLSKSIIIKTSGNSLISVKNFKPVRT